MAKQRTGHMGRAYDVRTPADNVELYEGWAATYDDDVVGEYGYVAPRNTVAAFVRHAGTDRIPVLDAGCGTGLAGGELKKAGVREVDGLDVSPAMLGEAEKKGVYRTLIEADLTGRIEIADDAYAACVSVGTFTHGHVGPEGLDELVRVTRPGGIVTFSINEGVYESLDFEAAFRRLEADGRATLVETEKLDYLTETAVRSWVATLRIA